MVARAGYTAGTFVGWAENFAYDGARRKEFELTTGRQTWGNGIIGQKGKPQSYEMEFSQNFLPTIRCSGAVDQSQGRTLALP